MIEVVVYTGLLAVIGGPLISVVLVSSRGVAENSTMHQVAERNLISLYRVTELLPRPIGSGQDGGNVVSFRAETVADGVNLSVSLDGVAVSGMDPFLNDIDPLTGPGRVGVGQETNPTYFDNITISCFEPVEDPDVRTQGYWKRVCNKPHPSGEHDCVNDTATFADVDDVNTLCDRLLPSPFQHPRCAPSCPTTP